MVISYNSQLGLRFKERSVKLDFCRLREQVLGVSYESLKERTETLKQKLKEKEEEIDNLPNLSEKELLEKKIAIEALGEEYIERLDKTSETQRKIKYMLVSGCLGGSIESSIDEFLKDDDTKYYLICDSIYRCAELIKIKENFTGRTLKDINYGKYTYLMGKNKMLRFICMQGAILGFYYDEVARVAFEWGIEMENGNYFFEDGHDKTFTEIMKILTFVELGDIEVKILEGGKNNGKPKNEGKVSNTSNKTVYVVDSTWNTILIRTEGFAVRGHYRLQACGEGLKDRKLIFIHAFEKHGYTRKPKAEIVR